MPGSLPPLTRDQMYTIAAGVGFAGKALDIAVAVAKQESSWIVDNVNLGSGASGLWQILPSAHPTYNVAKLRSDAVYNAEAAFKISNGGKNWQPWVAFTSNAYMQYMPGGVMAATSDTGNILASVTGSPIKYTAPPPTAEDARFTQKPFDKRHYRASNLGSAKADAYFGGPTFRGWISNVPTMVAASGDVSFSSQLANVAKKPAGTNINGADTTQNILHFLYNPTSITMAYSANANLLDNGSLDPSQFNPPQQMNGSTTTISFQLLFDRTFEVCDGDKLGVMSDIRTLERIIGITIDSPIMLSRPVEVSLSHDLSFRIKAVLTSLTVQFVHFSKEMVPMRCTVDVNGYRIPTNISSLNQQAAALLGTEPSAPASTTTTGTTTTTTTTRAPSNTPGTHGGLPSGTPVGPVSSAAPAYSLPAFGVPAAMKTTPGGVR